MKNFFYRVQKNDSVFSISDKFCVPVNIIIKSNNLTEDVAVGDLLYIEIPNGVLYRVKLSDTLDSLSQRFNISKNDILQKNKADYIYAFQLLIL